MVILRSSVEREFFFFCRCEADIDERGFRVPSNSFPLVLLCVCGCVCVCEVWELGRARSDGTGLFVGGASL